MLENYILKIQIESRVMSNLAMNHIIPTAIAYQNKLINNATGLKGLGMNNESVVATIDRISKYIDSIQNNCIDMIKERKRINQVEDTSKKAIAYGNDIKEKYFDAIRHAVDKLELIVDDEDWPLVKYREMLFLK
jgi:glutamine synthetase